MVIEMKQHYRKLQEAPASTFETYHGPRTMTAISGQVYTRMMTFEKAGDRNDGHAHNYDHTTVVVKGVLRIEVEGQEPFEARAPTMFITAAHEHHRLIALEDDTMCLCVHALRDGDSILDMRTEIDVSQSAAVKVAIPKVK